MDASLKVVLNNQKPYPNGELPVRLRITKDRKPRYIPLGLRCDPKLWDSDAGVPKKKHPFFFEFSEEIKRKVAQAMKLIFKTESENQSLSAQEYVKLMKKKKRSSVTLYAYFIEVEERLKGAGEIRNAKVYRDTKNQLQKFDNSTVHFSEANYTFLKKFEEYLKSTGKGLNTIAIYLRTFRALLNRAIKEGICPPEYYPFKNFSMSEYKRIKTKKRAISKADINKIRDFDTTECPELIDAKNAFLFSYYCRGINFIDICQLKYSDISDNVLTYTRQKTGGFFTMKLLPPVIEMLKYYRPLTFSDKNSYIFPLLNEGHKTKIAIHNRHTKMTTLINRQLKTIGEKCKIESELTTYVARHSYATIMKRSGHSEELISESMGHSSVAVTKIYLEEFENPLMDEAHLSLL